MSRYPGRTFAPSKYQIEAQESTDPVRLGELAQRSSNFVQSAVATNEATSPETLVLLAASENMYTRQAVARNRNTPTVTLVELSCDAAERVRTGVAYNKSTPMDVLVSLADDLRSGVRLAVARHRNLAPDVLADLASDPDALVRAQVARHANTTDEIVLLLLQDPTEIVRSAVRQRNFDRDAPTVDVVVRRFDGVRTVSRVVTRRVERGGRFSAEVIDAMARSDETYTAVRAASQPDAPQETLLRLARETTVLFTLAVIAENPGANAEVLLAVAERKDTTASKRVAVHPNASEDVLTMLALGGATSVHAEIAYKRHGGLAWMAAHVNPKVRRVAAKHSPRTQNTDFDGLLGRLVHDPDRSVAATAAREYPLAGLPSLVNHPEPGVRAVVAERARDEETLLALAADARVVVRRRVAANEAAPASALALLSQDTDPRVLASVTEAILRALA
jgi:hypothetical protein